MRQYHSLKKNVLLLIALLKELIIRRAIASPGSSAGSLQEPYFEMKSRDEGRSAAYMAWCHATVTNKSIIHCARVPMPRAITSPLPPRLTAVTCPCSLTRQFQTTKMLRSIICGNKQYLYENSSDKPAMQQSW